MKTLLDLNMILYILLYIIKKKRISIKIFLESYYQKIIIIYLKTVSLPFIQTSNFNFLTLRKTNLKNDLTNINIKKRE